MSTLAPQPAQMMNCTASTTAVEIGAGNINSLVDLLCRSRRLVVLTGAGCSTESGIPDYRDHLGQWKRAPPMQYQEFIGSHAARQRYWARAFVGWRQFRAVVPNQAHQVLARLERAGRIQCLITQNVDGLHQRAGSANVIDLHGRIDAVECLSCRRASAREAVQIELARLNPEWTHLAAPLAPDGDALLDKDFKSFKLVNCSHCEGPLKPEVVFFGESVPTETVGRAYAAVNAADALLVVGSSLMVLSGYRFVRAARKHGMPVAMINLGRSRADTEIDIKIEASCGQTLTAIEHRLSCIHAS